MHGLAPAVSVKVAIRFSFVPLSAPLRSSDGAAFATTKTSLVASLLVNLGNIHNHDKHLRRCAGGGGLGGGTVNVKYSDNKPQKWAASVHKCCAIDRARQSFLFCSLKAENSHAVECVDGERCWRGLKLCCIAPIHDALLNQQRSVVRWGEHRFQISGTGREVERQSQTHAQTQTNTQTQTNSSNLDGISVVLNGGGATEHERRHTFRHAAARHGNARPCTELHIHALLACSEATLQRLRPRDVANVNGAHSTANGLCHALDGVEPRAQERHGVVVVNERCGKRKHSRTLCAVWKNQAARVHRIAVKRDLDVCWLGTVER